MSSYEDKIKNAILIIQENLAEELNWTEISIRCGISEYHFHRIFSAVMKETPRNYIIRKRLEKAMSKIAYSIKEISLVDIALESGYSSQSNFTKAFKSYFGVTPKQARDNVSPKESKIGKIKSIYGKDFAVENLYPKNTNLKDKVLTSEVIMNVTINKFPEREIVYRTSKGGYKLESIHQLWTEFMTNLASLGNDMDSLTKLGIGHDNPQVTPEDKCRYDACVLANELSETPSNVNKMTIPAGKYACFRFEGKSKDLLDFYLKIYSNWFSENGCEPGNFPLIEKYIHIDKEDPEADIIVETQFLLK